MAAGRRILSAIGLLGALVAAYALTRFGAPPKAVLETRLVYEAAWWGAAVAAVFYVRMIERLSPGAFGARMPSWRDIVIAAGAGIVIVAGTVAIYMTLFPVLLLSISMSHIPNTMLMPYWYRLAMVARMAVTGELLFRALAVEHGVMVLPRGGKWLAAALSLAAFIAANWTSWSPVEAIATFFGGIVLTALYLWRRNLAVNVIASAIGLGSGYLAN
jgi:hypothetical protein